MNHPSRTAVAPPEQAERFVEKWRDAELSERAASHEHFIDLYRLIGQPMPAEADPDQGPWPCYRPRFASM